MNSNGSMFSVNKDALIGNVDPQLDYVEMDPKGRYVRVHSLYSYHFIILHYSPFAYISSCIHHICLFSSAHSFIHMIKLLLFTMSI